MVDFRSRVAAFTVGYPGVRAWLANGSDEGFWELYDVPPELPEGDVKFPDAEVFVFGAWHQVYGPLIRKLREQKPESRVVVAWSSSPTEMDNAQVEFLHVLGLRKEMLKPRGERLVDDVGVLHPGCARLFPRAFHLPAPVHLEEVVQPARGERSGVGFYAPATPKKNVFTHLLAVMELQAEDLSEDWTLFTNLDKYKPVIDGFELKAVIEPWMDRAAHLARLGERRVAFAASHAESWCYGAVDAMMAGTPVVASHTVPCVPASWRVDNPNDPGMIALKARWLVSSGEGARARDWVEGLAVRQNELVREAVEGLLASPVPA